MTVTVEADGYISQTVPDTTVSECGTTLLDIVLQPFGRPEDSDGDGYPDINFPMTHPNGMIRMGTIIPTARTDARKIRIRPNPVYADAELRSRFKTVNAGWVNIQNL